MRPRPRAGVSESPQETRGGRRSGCLSLGSECRVQRRCVRGPARESRLRLHPPRLSRPHPADNVMGSVQHVHGQRSDPRLVYHASCHDSAPSNGTRRNSAGRRGTKNLFDLADLEGRPATLLGFLRADRKSSTPGAVTIASRAVDPNIRIAGYSVPTRPRGGSTVAVPGVSTSHVAWACFGCGGWSNPSRPGAKRGAQGRRLSRTVRSIAPNRYVSRHLATLRDRDAPLQILSPRAGRCSDFLAADASVVPTRPSISAVPRPGILPSGRGSATGCLGTSMRPDRRPVVLAAGGRSRWGRSIASPSK